MTSKQVRSAEQRLREPLMLPFHDHALPMWLADAASTRVLDANDAALRLFGYARADFLELTEAALEAPVAAEPAEGALAAARRHRRRDGRLLSLRLSSVPVQVAGKPARLVTAIDLTAEIDSVREARRRERVYQQIFEVASDWYWEMDAQMRILAVSPNLEAVSGLPITSMIGKRIDEIAGAAIDPETTKQAYAALAARVPFRDLVYATRPWTTDGRPHYVKASGVPVFDRDGAFQGYCGVSKDVTAQFEAELSLRDSEQRFKDLYEAASDYFWEMDEQLRITYLSPNFAQIFGVSLDDFIGKRLLETPGLSPEPELMRQFGAAIAARKPFRDLTVRRHYPGGRRFVVKLSGIPVFGENGTFHGYRGVGSDITQQKLAAEAATLAQGRLEDAVSHVRQPFVLYDAEDRILAFNQAFADLHHDADAGAYVYKGVPFRRVAELRLGSGFYADGDDDAPLRLETLIERHEEDGEHVCHLSDDRWMLVDHRQLPGGGSLDLWTDITAIRHARHAEAANRAKSEFLARMSHELRTPLNAVIGYSEMLLEDAEAQGGEAQQIADLRRINTAGKHLLALVNDVLDLSKIEAGKMDLASEDFDLGSFIDDVVATCRPLVLANGNVLAVERADGPAAVRGDATKLRQVVLNLLSNAAKFTKGGRVTLAAALEGDLIRVSVSDTGIGIGISVENLPRLFQNFSQIDAGASRYGGTGLGLALSRRICRLMGGDIDVESEPGRGSCFTVRVPRMIAPAPPVAAAAG